MRTARNTGSETVPLGGGGRSREAVAAAIDTPTEARGTLHTFVPGKGEVVAPGDRSAIRALRAIDLARDQEECRTRTSRATIALAILAWRRTS
jgi:hypothetical protein